MMEKKRTYIAIDLKSFYASVECKERNRDPLTTNLVVADKSRTEKTICLAVSPALKNYGIPGRARLFEVVQKVKEANSARRWKAPNRTFIGSSDDSTELNSNPARLYCCSSPDGSLSGIQHQNLQHLSEIYCTGRYFPVFD